MMRFYFFILFLTSLLLGNAQTKTGNIDCLGATIHYKVYGDKGKPVLLINGGPGYSSNYLHDVALEMSKHRIVILFDQRGTGKSTVEVFDKMSINIHRNIRDIEAIREELDYKKWDVIGHAYGSALAMIYSYKYPNRIDRMILTSPIGMNLDFVEPMMANLRLRLNANKSEELIAKAQADNPDLEYNKERFDLIAEAYVYDKSKLHIAQAMHKEPKDYVVEVNQIIWDELKAKNYNIEAQMKFYRGKVLILHGRQDVIGESVPLHTHNVLPNSQLVFFNEAGRYLWLDQPEAYYAQVNDFLR